VTDLSNSHHWKPLERLRTDISDRDWPAIRWLSRPQCRSEISVRNRGFQWWLFQRSVTKKPRRSQSLKMADHSCCHCTWDVKIRLTLWTPSSRLSFSRMRRHGSTSSKSHHTRMEQDICSWSRTRGTRRMNWRPSWTPSSSAKTATSLTPKTCCCPWWPTIDHTFVNSPFSEFWSHQNSRKGRAFDIPLCRRLTLTAQTIPQWSTGRRCDRATRHNEYEWWWPPRVHTGTNYYARRHIRQIPMPHTGCGEVHQGGNWGITVCVWQESTRRLYPYKTGVQRKNASFRDKTGL